MKADMFEILRLQGIPNRARWHGVQNPVFNLIWVSLGTLNSGLWFWIKILHQSDSTWWCVHVMCNGSGNITKLLGEILISLTSVSEYCAWVQSRHFQSSAWEVHVKYMMQSLPLITSYLGDERTYNTCDSSCSQLSDLMGSYFFLQDNERLQKEKAAAEKKLQSLRGVVAGTRA